MVVGGTVAVVSSASADVVHPDDTIIQFSLCVGNDCVNGESFGFDTMRLKENNLRIHFNDTSNSASFPTNDWRIVINDSSNGGANYFAIEDSNTGRQVFRVENGARSNALYVESDGDIGVGTANPATDIHIQTGNTPTLRLDQDGSSGFTAQTWDLAGNEANFFLRDVTNSSALPIRVQPGAGGERIFLETGGQIGFGTTAPAERMHLYETTDRIFGMRYEHTGGGSGNLATVWRTVVDARSDKDFFQITRNGTGNAELQIQSNGDVVIPGTLTTGGGTCGGGCDAVFQDGFDLPSIDEHAEQMWANGFLPNVGPTIENEPINISDKVGRILNEVETAHIYIDQLDQRVDEIERLRAENAELRAINERLLAIEARLAEDG